ncbi:hypothetical protein GCM10023172_41350 [Hymenobacter ginsengisoli]|uniref:Uncharacterized protein n=1 Tax=Hymenobacter ginsengisoli TaxID=1051626 RepID=A0ABP8QQF8_9BACT|nr:MULTISPECIES: hypothetical protein [unclassified Hymenobacter]MBO2032221.1 hypothetical protein [Hymenobacter sp. BT559]
MHPNTELANRIIQEKLLGSTVESFGLTHQFLTLTFRDKNADDHTIWIDTEVTSKSYPFQELNLDETGAALLLFNSVNLKEVVAIQCNDEATLEIQFDNGIHIFFAGSPAEESMIEPWSLGTEMSNAASSIIATHGGGYIIFEGRQDM